jgi:acyl-CoA synthetase (AMP-forming)/AMP-acid ligase II
VACAVISTDAPGGLTREQVLDRCRRRLPAHMVPDMVECRDALSRNSNGKVDRARLAERRK